MAEHTNIDAAASSSGLLSRVVGVLFSPKATYAGVAARPRALGVLLLVIVVSGALMAAFLSSEVGKDALFEQQMSMIESFGFQLPDEAYVQMEAGLDRAAYTTPIGQAVGMALMATVVAGLVLALFNAVLGGNATFKQVFAVVAHSGVIFGAHALFMVPLNYARGAMSSPTTLAAFAPFLDSSSFPARFLGLLDLAYIWWIVNLSIGIGVLYRKRTAPIAISALTVYVVFAVLVGAVMARFGAS